MRLFVAFYPTITLILATLCNSNEKCFDGKKWKTIETYHEGKRA
tara:strand:+ start:791 stop:922 length:132 start_codon:yes stop_codon:yes gene_type:complete